MSSDPNTVVPLPHARLETYQRVFHSSPDFISVSRIADGVYVDVNAGFERMTGYYRDDVLGRTALDIGVWPEPQEGERVIHALRQSRGVLHAFPARMQTRRGEIRHVELSASLAGTGSEQLLLVIVRDVTERDHASVELQQLREHLETLIEHRTAALRETNGELLETNRRLGQAHLRALDAERRMQHMSLHDALTGLPNRALLHDRIMQAISMADRDVPLALLFIDLDRFKQVNDSFGHSAGDLLLRLVAQRLRSTVRRSDTIARLGADEFVICATHLDKPDDAARLAHKILQQLEAPFIVAGRPFQTGASIGISLYPGDGRDADELMRAADTAMHHAKDRGRGHAQFYTPALSAAVQRRTSIEAELRLALPQRQLVLHYQPQVDLRSGRVVAVEALVRWQHPERGLLAPLEFIPVAEESSLILRLGEWVLREACTQLRRWHDAGHGDLGVAVNLSARQILQPGFIETVAAILDETGIPPASLDLELTESMLMQPIEESSSALTRLAALGVRLSVDDFGTGYSSLSYLRRFPIHALKIDRSFVQGIGRDPSDLAIAQAILAMAGTLKLDVIAEGVETAEQAALLAESECALVQGYYYARPGPASSLEAFLKKSMISETVATYAV